MGGIKTTAWLQVDPTTGSTIAVSEDGEHQSYEYAVANVYSRVVEGELEFGEGVNLAAEDCVEIAEADASIEEFFGTGVIEQDGSIQFVDTGYKQALQGVADAAKPLIEKAGPNPQFSFAVARRFMELIAAIDPPIGDYLSNPASISGLPASLASGDVRVAANVVAGATAGSAESSSLSVAGNLVATWSLTATGSFKVRLG